MKEKAIHLLEEQQKKVQERSAPWMVAEQLKDICRAEADSAELIAQDLENKAMSIVEAEKKIKAFADSHKKGNSSCVGPQDSDRVLREFYGLRKPGEAPAAVQEKPAHRAKVSVDLADFW